MNGLVQYHLILTLIYIILSSPAEKSCSVDYVLASEETSKKEKCNKRL